MLEIAVLGSLILTFLIFVLDRLPMAKAAMILVVNADAEKEQTARIMDTVKKYSKYHKVKSRNITDGQLDLVIEELRSHRQERCRLYTSLGVMAGIFLAVLLL